jgi:hypothetical protein
MSLARLLARLRRLDGTASVELVGILPAFLVVVLIAAQVAAAGYALWSAALAARAGARAAAVSGDSQRVARRALPSLLREGAVVRGQEAVSVRVDVPRLLKPLPRFDVGARTRLLPEPAGG